MMDIPVQFRLSPDVQTAGYRRPGMTGAQLNARARADRKARVEALAEHDRKIDALFAEARKLTEGKWGTDHHHGVPKPRLIGARAKHGHLFGDAPTASKTPRWDAFRAKHGHLFELAWTAATPRRAEAALAKSLEPPLPVYLLDVEPCRYVGGEVHEIEKTWGDGDRIWTTRELTVFGEQALMEGRYP